MLEVPERIQSAPLRERCNVRDISCALVARTKQLERCMICKAVVVFGRIVLRFKNEVKPAVLYSTECIVLSVGQILQPALNASVAHSSRALGVWHCKGVSGYLLCV